MLTLIASLKRLQREVEAIKEQHKLCFEQPNSTKCPTITFCKLLGEKIQEIREVRDTLVTELIAFTANAKITSKQFLELIDRAYAVNLNLDQSCKYGFSTSFDVIVEKYIETFNTVLEKLLSDSTLSLFIDTILMVLRPEVSAREQA